MQRIFRAIQKSTEPINNFINSQAYQNIIEQQKAMAEIANSFVNSQAFQNMIELQNKMSKIADTFFHSQAFHNIVEQHKEISKIANNFVNSQAFQNMMEQQGEIARVIVNLPHIQFIKDIDFDDIQFDSEEFKAIIESQDEKISDSEKIIIKDFLEISAVVFPEINVITKYYENKNYKKSAIALIRFMIIYLFISYQLYTEFIDKDKYYTANRDNVRVRLSPEKNNNTNIITKLSKNTYLEKIDSENGWIKVRFELDDGIEKEGWIFRTMLTRRD